MTLPGFPPIPPPSARIGQAMPAGYRQGVIQSWNPLTLQNTVEIDGVLFTDLPVLGLAEFATFSAGDVVGLLVAGDTMAIIGQIVTPNTAQASEALGFLGAFVKSASVISLDTVTSTSYGDLAHVGPTVSAVHIGPSGKALVLLTAEMFCNEAASAVYMSVDVSAPSGIGPDDGKTLKLGKSGTLVAANLTHEMRATAAIYYDGTLTPGDQTFTAKYRVSVTGGAASASVASRNVTVIPL